MREQTDREPHNALCGRLGLEFLHMVGRILFCDKRVAVVDTLKHAARN
jgi:hypothetical protein